MPCVLQRTDQDGGYVAREGHHESYTHIPSQAKIFPNRDIAEANRCPGNEVIIDISQILRIHQ